MFTVGTVTVKAISLLSTPPRVTTTLPVVAPVGTSATMHVALQLETVVTGVPLNVTVLPLWLAPKLAPAIITEVPTGPEIGLRLVMVGGGVTVKSTLLLSKPPTVTTTFPVVAPAGTAATMLVALQLDTVVTGVPLNVTVLPLWLAPKFAPAIVTEAPTGPDVGFRLLTAGAVVTVKATPLLATPARVTTTLPVVAPVGTGAMMLVALQLVGVAGVPLKVTVVLLWLAPKFAPAIVTEVLTGPEAGLKLVMLGGGVTVKSTPLLSTPPTVTTTLPVVAPVGTDTAILFALQLETVVTGVPLNVTVLPLWLAPKFAPAIVIDAPTGPDVGLRLVMLGAVLPLLAA